MSLSTANQHSPTEIPLLRAATTAFVARYKGQSRIHAESDLNAFFRWCDSLETEPLACRRVDIELYLRWMQLSCKYKPSTISDRSVTRSRITRLRVHVCRIHETVGLAHHPRLERTQVRAGPSETPTSGRRAD